MVLGFGSLTALLVLCQWFVALVKCAQIAEQVQMIDQRVFNVLNATRPPMEFNATTVRTFCSHPETALKNSLIYSFLYLLVQQVIVS